MLMSDSELATRDDRFEQSENMADQKTVWETVFKGSKPMRDIFGGECRTKISSSGTEHVMFDPWWADSRKQKTSVSKLMFFV